MERRNFLLAAGASCLATSFRLPALVGEPENGASDKNVAYELESFEYRGVTLLPGRFRQQVEQTRDLYFNMSNDDMLKGFRRDAGLPDPGKDMEGWAKHNCSATFGQWISGMARLSCATGDSEMRAKAIALTEGWEKTLGPDGNCRMGTYAWEKMSCGLVDLALYANYPRALDILDQITQWASRNFDRSRSPATPIDRDGRRPKGTLEWYTLSENAYRAYLTSGNRDFRNFGDLWHYPSYWNLFENSASPQGAAYLHSYSHINTFCGVAMAYAVTGDPHYLKILRNAYDFALKTQAYVTGGYGPGEWSVPADGTLGRALEIRSDSAEIPCGSWAGFKLSRYLMGFTGEAHYGEWIETLLYNGIGSALPVQPDGSAFYYADYRLNTGTKLYHWDKWPCCSGTYIQAVADYHNVIYFKNATGLYINLFIPSEVTWRQSGQQIVLRQETEFPESGESNFELNLAVPTAFALRFRVPSWCTRCDFQVNGRPIAVDSRAGEWATIERTWSTEDKVTVKLQMPLHLVPVDMQHPNRAAVMYGPVLLAQDARFSYPLAIQNERQLNERFVKDGEDLHFRVRDVVSQVQPTGSFRPFSDFPERSPYRIYFDLTAPRFL
jgi:uncharacterized protein